MPLFCFGLKDLPFPSPKDNDHEIIEINFISEHFLFRSL